MSQGMFVGGEAYSVALILFDDPWMRNLHWRWLILMGAIPAGVLLVLGYFLIFEAPGWLALHGQYDKACEVLTGMAKKNGKPNLDIEFHVSHVTARAPMQTRLLGNLKIIVGPNLRFTTFVLCFTLFGVNTFYYGGGMYAFLQVLPEITTRTSPGINLLIGVFFEIPGYLLALWLSEYLSRKATIIFGYIGLLVCMATFLWMSAIVETPRFADTGEMGMQASFFMFKCFSGMLFGIVYAYSMEVYPTIARTTGVAVGISTGRIGAISSPVLYEWLHEMTGSFHAFFYFMMSLCILGSLLVFLLPYETKGEALKDHVEEIEPVVPLKESSV
jgi:putative MFS transporter